MADIQRPIRVLVAGSTGAIGHNVVKQMLGHPRCTRITALSRRDVPREQWRATWPGDWTDEQADKMEVRAIDWERLLADEQANNIVGNEYWKDLFREHNWVVMAFGPVYQESGSMANHRRYNLDYVRALITAVKAHCGPCFYTAISGKSCESNSWFEALRIKGEANDIAVAQFNHLSIMKPGLLDRAEKNRTGEKIFKHVLPSTKVADIATACIRDYEAFENEGLPESAKRYNQYDISGIKSLAGVQKKCFCSSTRSSA